MIFIHLADIHASRERLPQTLSILNTLTERCKEGDIDFVLFAGDFWDSTITATKGSGFSDIIAAIRNLEKHTYLYFIYGTPAHEPNGSLDAFISEKTKVVSENSFDIFIGKDRNTDIIYIPEPRRSKYIRNSMDETNKTINEDIKEFIDSRKKKPADYNRIVVYHGEVKGAVYQNGITASSPTAIPKKLLQSLNADYYALGHIHIPQEVFPNAWYPGSACPKNFGEPHDGHYNLVTVENGKTKVEQVSFGLPTYVTFYQRPDNFIEGNPHQNENTNFRFIFDCTKEERKLMNIRAYADEVKARLRALSVKIEPNVIENETIQTSEVSKSKSIVEKMTAYAKEKNLKIPKYAKELLQNIQDGTLGKLAYPQHSFELLSLSLRGSIGIRDGQNKEEIKIDFEKYEDGVICLSAPHGRGKSSLLENCHPYPKMLSRKGTLQDHFYLKDSHRILVYRDENDLYYRISMLIDGKTANGKVSYFVETSKDREVWKSVPDVDGSSETYKEWVNNTFGTIDVYLRTAFFAKEDTKDAADISDTTKSERMELLSKLAGTEQLKEVSLLAREKRKELESQSYEIESEINAYTQNEETIQENEEEIKTWNNELKALEDSLCITEKKIAEFKAADAEYQKVKAVTEANNALRSQYQKELDERSRNLKYFEECADNKEVYDNIAECNATLRNNAPRIDELSKTLTEKRKGYNKVDDELTEHRKSYSVKLKLQREYENVINGLKTQIVKIDAVCPTCGQPLSEHKKSELQNHVDETQKELDRVAKELENHNIYVKDVEDHIKESENVISELKKEINSIENELKELEDIREQNTAYINKYSQLYVEYTYNEVVAETKLLRADVAELKSKIESLNNADEVEDVSDKLKDAEDKLKREQNQIAELKINIKSTEKENERLQNELKSVEDKKTELKTLQEKFIAYGFIEDTFSNKGIPAVELRESAPEIADITNMILKESYGTKFTVRFGPSSELKSKKKIDEDFNIIITDNDNNDEKTIDWVSSGEKIWIKQALFYAFSIVQMNRTGFNFKTRFIDESDGSIDGPARPKYLKMVETAHKYSNSRITVMITHSQEIKDIAQQIIEL